jgi:hypothetical protein
MGDIKILTIFDEGQKNKLVFPKCIAERGFDFFAGYGGTIGGTKNLKGLSF